MKTKLQTEKELSDAKIDIRIAKREAKTAEDTVTRLQEEIKNLTEKLSAAEEKSQKSVSAEREKLDKLILEKNHVKVELSQRDSEIKMLKNQLEELEELKKIEKQLKRDLIEATQKCKMLEKEIDKLQNEKEKEKINYESIDKKKSEMEKTIEELKQKISSFENISKEGRIRRNFISYVLKIRRFYSSPHSSP